MRYGTVNITKLQVLQATDEAGNRDPSYPHAFNFLLRLSNKTPSVCVFEHAGLGTQNGGTCKYRRFFAVSMIQGSPLAQATWFS